MGIVVLLGVASTFKQLEADIDAEAEKERKRTCEKLNDDLSKHTPVKTGKTSKAWKVTDEGVENDTPQINKLNAGSSRQAAPYFVEATALKYGKPNGLVAHYK